MANRITTIIDFVTDGASRQLSGFKAKIAEADTATGKMKAGFGAAGDFIKQNAASIATTAGASLIAFGATAAKAFTETAIEADNLASLTGDTVEQSSRLNAIWKQSGADSKDLQDVLLQMNGVLATNQSLVKQLGIDLNDGATVGQRFEQVAEALDQIPDAARRSQIASQVFGEEGVRQYNALRTAVGDVGDAMAGVSDSQVIDQDEVDKARRFQASMKQLQIVLKDVTMTTGELLVPALTDMSEALTDIKEGIDGIPGLPSVLEAGLRSSASGWKALGDGIELVTGSSKEAIEAASAFDAAQSSLNTALTAGQEAAAEEAAAVEALNVSMTGTESSAYLVDAAIDAAKSRLDRFGEDGVENMNDVEGAADDVTESVEDIRDELAGLRQDIANDQSAIDLAEQFDQFRTSAVDAFTAASEGADDAEQKQRDYRTEMNTTKQAVIDYATEILGLPAERVTQLVAMIDEGAADQVEALLNNIARNRFVRFSPSGTQGGAAIDGPNTDARAGASSVSAQSVAPVTNIYNAVSVNAVDPGLLLYDLDRMAKGLG